MFTVTLFSLQMKNSTTFEFFKCDKISKVIFCLYRLSYCANLFIETQLYDCIRSEGQSKLFVYLIKLLQQL